MPDELRCPSRLHALFIEEEDVNGKIVTLIEVKCRSKACGAGSGVVVLHYFNKDTMELTKTKKLRDPEGVKS